MAAYLLNFPMLDPLQALVDLNLMILGIAPSAAFSVKAYGAAGNGVSNDTAAIQRAINAASTAGGGVVYFPTGTYLISPPTTAEVFNVPSGNIAFRGDGVGLSILKMASGAGDYYTVFGPKANDVSYLWFRDLTFDQNSTGNPVTSSITTYIRAFVWTNLVSTSLTVEDCEFTDVNALNIIVSYNTETIVRNCRFSGVGGGSVYHDSSLLYVAADSATIENNIFISNGPGSAGANAAIETHGGKMTVTGNSIDGFQVGMNITGVAPTESSAIAVVGNTIARGYYGIEIYSGIDGSHESGNGVNGLVIAGNTIRLAQTLYSVNAQSGAAPTGNPSGIFVNPTANLPLINVSITGNTITFDLESSSSAPYNDAGMGIGYWDSLGTNSISQFVVSDNMIVSANVNAIRFAVNMEDVLISGNMILNSGSSVSSSLIAAYQNGIFLASTTAAKDIRVLNNVITDNNSTARMVRGISLFLAASSDVVILGNVFTVSGATYTAYLYPIDASVNTILPFAKNTQVLPAVSSGSFSAAYFAAGSILTDASNGATWSVTGANGTWVANPMVPTPGATDNSNKAADTAFVASQIVDGTPAANSIPKVVYTHTGTGNSSASAAYATVYTTLSAGIFRVSASIYPTTLSTGAWTVEVAAQVTQNGATGAEGDELVAAPIGTSFGSETTSLPRIYNLPSSATIGIGTFTTAGSNTGGVFTYAVTIERLA